MAVRIRSRHRSGRRPPPGSGDRSGRRGPTGPGGAPAGRSRVRVTCRVALGSRWPPLADSGGVRPWTRSWSTADIGVDPPRGRPRGRRSAHLPGRQGLV